MPVCLWHGLLRRIDAWDADWRRKIDGEAIDRKIRKRLRGDTFTDAEIFEGLVLSVLSGNTQWATVERIQHELPDLFHGFELARFAATAASDIDHRFVPWFLERRAGSTGLKRGLLRLRETAEILQRYSTQHGGADRYFDDALADHKDGPDGLAVAIGSDQRWKLPGFGVALAAEALRNIGFDLSKPDRHVLRCVGAWALVDFHKWPLRSDYTAPQATPVELHRTMGAVRSLATANGLGVSYANSVIWTAGALSGARFANAEFVAIRVECERLGRQP